MAVAGLVTMKQGLLLLFRNGLAAAYIARHKYSIPKTDFYERVPSAPDRGQQMHRIRSLPL
jgi:hypothetical protein